MNKFPQGFLWGAATASYQVEGGIENNDWAEAARGGKVPICGRATDHYNRFESDFDIAHSLGHNAHRISIEWSRIEPENGKFNDDEIEHYYRRWYLRPILKSLGCYPVAKRAWTLHNFLSTTIEKVEAGKVVMFFPEGKIIKSDADKKPRVGIGYLVEQTQKPILPLHIKWDGSRPTLTFGKVIISNSSEFRVSNEEVSIKIMSAIYSL